MRNKYDLKKLKKREGSVKSDADAAKVAISIRLDGAVLASLKTEAMRLGLPYQTFIGSVLHQYVNGELVEKRALEQVKQLKMANG